MDKLILLPMRSLPQILIVRASGYQIQMVVQIDLIQLRACAAVLEGRTAGYSEPARKVVGNSRAPLHVACNVVRVVARFGYTLGVSYEDRGHVWQCRERRQATQSSFLEIRNMMSPTLYFIAFNFLLWRSRDCGIPHMM